MIASFQLCSRIQLSTLSQEQIFLPIRLGGLGLHNSLPLSPAVYLTKQKQFSTFGSDLLQLPESFWQENLGDFQIILDNFALEAPPSTSQAIQWLSANVRTQAHHDDFSIRGPPK